MDAIQMEKLVKPLWGEKEEDLLKVPGLGYGIVSPLMVEKVMGDTRFLRCSCSAEVTAFEVNAIDAVKRAVTKCVKCK